jgi:hypothetical protein
VPAPMIACTAGLRAGWGGARVGAGRPARAAIPSEPHKRRPRLASHHPVHVTARLADVAAQLSRRRAYQAVRHAVRGSLIRADFRIVSLALDQRALTLVVEADDERALARGMQGFQVAAARAINRALARTGRVFPDRYRARILTTAGSVTALLAGRRPGWPSHNLPRWYVFAAPSTRWLAQVSIQRARPP